MKLHHLLELLVGGCIVLLIAASTLLHNLATAPVAHSAALTVATQGTIESLDSTQYSSRTASATIQSLIVGLYARDAAGKVVPAIAETPRVSADKRTYTFNLRAYHWNNGARVTAQDFVYAWQRLADPKRQARNAARIDILQNGLAVRTGKMPLRSLGAKTLSATRLQIRLAQANPYLKEILADTPLLPINRAFAQAAGSAYGTSAKQVLGNGPYRLNDWAGPADHAWRFVKNPTYYHHARVRVARIDFETHDDLVKAARLFVQNKLDYTALAPQQVPHFKGNRQLRTQRTTTEALLFFNTTTGATSNRNLRLALAQGFDKHDFTQSRLRDGAEPLNGLIPAGLVAMADRRDYRATTGDLLPYDLPKATAAWNRAKKQLGVNRLTLTLTIADNDTAVLAADFLRSQLEHNLPGLTLAIHKVSLTQRVALEAAGKFELVFSTWTPADGDPLNLLAFYQTGSRLNITGFTDAKFDRLAQSVAAAGASPKRRMASVQKAERYLMSQQVPAAGFFQDGAAYLLADRVARLPLMPSGNINFEYARMR